MFVLSLAYFVDIFKKPRFAILVNIVSIILSLSLGIFTISIFRGMKENTLRKVVELNGEVYIVKNAHSYTNRLRSVHKITQIPCVTLNHSAVNLKCMPKSDLDAVFGKYLIPAPTHNSGDASSDLSGFVPVYVSEAFIRQNNIKRGTIFPLLTIKSCEVQILDCMICGIFETGLKHFDEATVLTSENIASDYSEAHVGYLKGSDGACFDTSEMRVFKNNEDCVTWMESFKELYDMFNTNLMAIFLLMGIFFMICALQILTIIFQIMHNTASDMLILKRLGMNRRQKWGIYLKFSLIVTGFILLVSDVLALGLISSYKQIETFMARFLVDIGAVMDFKCELFMKDFLGMNFFAFITMLTGSLFALKAEVK